MQNQSKSIFVAGIVLLVAVLICIFSYITYANQGNRKEQAIIAQWNNNKNILGTCTNQILEVAQVPAMYRDDLLQIINADVQGRYAQDKSLVAKFVQERALNFDSSMYAKIQQVMSSCSNKFENTQSKLLDMLRDYQTDLGNFWSGFWLSAAGYPKNDLSQYKIVVARDTDKIFEEGARDPIKLR